MEINAAAMFLVHASPLDLAVGEDGAAAVMVIVKAWMDKLLYGGMYGTSCKWSAVVEDGKCRE